MITGVDHVHVMCKDLDQSIAFYTQVLGFRMLRRVVIDQGSSKLEVAFVGIGDMLVELFPLPPGTEEVPAAAQQPFGVMVDDMDKTLAGLREHGVDVLEERLGWTFSGRFAAIKDPSGVTIEIRQWYSDDGPYNQDWQPINPAVVRIQ